MNQKRKITYDCTKPYISKIVDVIKETWSAPFIQISDGFYPIIERELFHPKVEHVDGCGSKGIYHWKYRTFKELIQDSLSMNLNDLAIMNAQAYKLSCHLTLPEDDEEAILTIMKHLSSECKARQIAIVGGETAIMNNLEGADLSLTVTGFIKNRRTINQCKIGDVLIGIESNGLHSNGFTLIRELFKDDDRLEFTNPTYLYDKVLLKLFESVIPNGLIHITGGGYSKLKKILPNDADIYVVSNHSLNPQEIYYDIYNKGTSDTEMYSTFNCGVGFILSVNPLQANEVIERLKPFKADIIGIVQFGSNKIEIGSKFSKWIIIL